MSKKGIRKKHFSIVFRCKLVGSISKESGDLMGDASVPAFVFLLGECNVAAIGAGFEVGFVAVIPFAFARAISVKAKRNCGSPYTKREEESVNNIGH